MRYLFALAAAFSLYAESLPQQTADNMHLVVTPTQKIELPPALSRILERFHIKNDGKIQSIIPEVQNKWVRPSGQERWHLPYLSVAHEEELYKDFRELGLMDEILPTKKHYDYAVVLGAAVPRIKLRLAHLVRLWNQGVRFKQIVFLTADRPLDPEFEEGKPLLYDMPPELPLSPDACSATLPKTEAEALAFFYHNCSLPPKLKALPLQIVTAKTTAAATIGKHRPNTGDTVAAWFNYKPRPGSVLAISNQPFVGYQFSVMRHVLPPYFDLEVVGEKCGDDYNPAVLLDTIARWMFVEVCEFD